MFRISLRVLCAGGAGAALIALLANDIKALVGGTCIALVTPVLLVALRRGHARFAMTGAVSAVWLVACTEVAMGDGIRDVGMSLFTVVVLVSTLLLERHISVFFSLLSVLSVGAIGIAGLEGWLPSPLARAVVPGELAILVFLLSMFAVLMHAVARALYKGLEEAALNEQTYREIFNATSDAIFIHEAERGRIVDVNRAACALSGFSHAELIGRDLSNVPRRAGDSDAPQVLAEHLQRARSEGLRTFEWQGARKDGHEIWLEIALHAARIRGQECVLAAVRDISDRKAAAEQVRAAERLKSLGQLAGGVAHDFNNQLSGIVSSATLLKEKLRSNPAAQVSLDLILQCSQRSADLTRQLLAFARKGERREDVVEVEGLVREVVSLLERSIDKRVTITVEVASGTGARVIGDASFLGSALVNLGLNARDAMPHGGMLRFEIHHVREGELPERARAQLPKAGDVVQIRVSDTGVGIAPEALARTFEPFFTTKPQGSGLGLSAAYGTVQAHGGAILVTSTLGVGTTFDLFLPATNQPVQSARERRPSQPIPQVRVLLAEDEPEVGRATELVLQELGCVVTWRRDGRAALETFERQPDAFDVVVLDHSMPRMLGSEVGDRIAALCPSMWIIAISGFAEEASSDRDRLRRIFLPKPFGLEQLSAALDRVFAHREQ